MSINKSLYEELVLESNDQKRSIDIKNGVIAFEYFEDIFSPTITGKIKVVNTGNTIESFKDQDGEKQSIYNGLPLRGGERLSIKLAGNVPGRESLDFSKDPKDYFYVSSITDVISEAQNESFTLNLVSREAITNETSRVARKYSTSLKINETVRKILTDVLKTDRIGTIDETSNKYGFVGNLRKPFTTLIWLASKSVPVVSGDATAGFVFYQTRDGFQFRAIDNLIAQKPKATYVYNPTTVSYDDKNKKVDNEFKILNYSTEKNQNLIEKLRLGTYSSSRVFYDPLKFTFTESIFQLKDYDNKSENLGGTDLKLPKISEGSDQSLGDVPSRIITAVLDIGTIEAEVSKDENADPSLYQSQSLMRYNILFSQILNVMVPGNIDLRAGDVIECLFPTNSITDKKEHDPETSGLYMIKELCHHFNTENSYTSLKLIRDTFGINNKEKEMIDESLLKSNFVGRDGFRWWIGQVAPEDAQGGQINGEGWGNRRKVRIMGYHPHDLTELPDKDLPWAQCMLPTTTGTGAGNNGTNVKILPGDSVFGFFIDGDNAQLPVIIGAFGKTAEGAVSNQFSFPFKPFTGYTSKIKNDGSSLKRDQTNEGTKETQKSPYHLPTKATNEKPGGEEISYFSGIGDKVQFASTKPNTAVDKISTELENALKFVQTLKSYKDLSKEYIDEQIEKLCKEISKKIQGISTGIVGGVLNDTYKKMIPSLNSGVEKVYDDVSSKVEQATGSISTAHLAGAAAQTETIPQLKKLQDEIPKLGKCIVKDLFNIIDEMLCALLKNIANLVSCVIDQFLGGLLNAIIGAIELGLNLAMGALGIAKLLQGFDLGSIIRGSSKGIAGVSFIAECGECPSPPDPSVERWMIGSGVISSPDTKLSKLLEVANTAKGIVDGVTGAIDAVEGAIDAVGGAIAGVTGALDIFSSSISGSGTQSALGACYAGPPKSCNPPKLKVFGGGGFGAEVIPIFGSIVSGNVGSLIGAVITNAGSGYISAPFVEVTDNCNQGYGGIVQTTINTTGPLAGQVASVVVISDGENYPIGTQNPDVFTIIDVLIENPGVEYEPDDIVIDNLGNEYSVVINNGSIVKVDPINVKNIEELPVLEVVGKKNSIGISEVTQGRGAILRPIFGIKPEFQGEVQQIIDCVYPKSSETPLITPTPTTTPITTLTSTSTTTSTSTSTSPGGGGGELPSLSPGGGGSSSPSPAPSPSPSPSPAPSPSPSPAPSPSPYYP